jgi:hypothetical protein
LPQDTSKDVDEARAANLLAQALKCRWLKLSTKKSDVQWKFAKVSQKPARVSKWEYASGRPAPVEFVESVQS